jgi:hypothetical protein
MMAPVSLHRQESLGVDSIRDMDQMENFLGLATNKLKRVSRQKMMSALFSVEDCLEDNEENNYLVNELHSVMKAAREKEFEPVGVNPLVVIDDEMSELTTRYIDEFTCDDSLFEEERVTNEAMNLGNDGSQKSPFISVCSVGKLLRANNDDQQAVEEVLDDLLWTEFVSSRQEKKNSDRRLPNTTIKTNVPLRIQPKKSQKISLQIKQYNIPVKIPDRNDEAEEQAKRFRSWWRNRPFDKSVYSFDDEDHDYGDDADASSDEFPSYLPTGIAVKERNRKAVIDKQLTGSSFSRQVSSRYKVFHATSFPSD